MKYFVQKDETTDTGSPSTRREWIEICLEEALEALIGVSLHTEGVD